MKWFRVVKTIVGGYFYNKAIPINIRTENSNILERYARVNIKISEYMGYTHHLVPTKFIMAWKEECFFAGGELESWCERNCKRQWAYVPEIENDFYVFYFLDRNDAAFFKMVWK